MAGVGPSGRPGRVFDWEEDSCPRLDLAMIPQRRTRGTTEKNREAREAFSTKHKDHFDFGLMHRLLPQRNTGTHRDSIVTIPDSSAATGTFHH